MARMQIASMPEGAALADTAAGVSVLTASLPRFLLTTLLLLRRLLASAAHFLNGFPVLGSNPETALN
jgi:hypothetical protein